MPRISIIGLGLIGSSLGLALRQAGGDFEVVGHDRQPEVASRAKKRGAVDKTEWSLPNTVADSQLVIIATPVIAVETILETIVPHLRQGCVVTDTASTKSQVVKLAERLVPPGISFIGGHPMAGKEKSGPEEADPALFQNRTYCLTPLRTATDAAVDLVVGLVNAVGARPLFIDPAEHDGYAAAVSHLPFVAATALVRTVITSPAWRDISQVAATGFRDTTRVASGDTEMYRDICLTNREAILRWLDLYLGQLAEVRSLLAEGDAGQIESALRAAKEGRDEWLRAFEGQPAGDAALGTVPRDELRQMLIGRWGEDKGKRGR
jgi:prephenate dehydrogenase